MLFQIPGVRDPLSPGPTRQQTFPVPPVGQPALDRYAVLQHQNRYLTGPQQQIHQGASVQATHPTPPVSNPVFNYYRPDINQARIHMWVGPRAQFEGATKQQTHIFPPNQPEYPRQSVYNRNQFTPGVVPQFVGDTSTTIFATYTSIGRPGIRMVMQAKDVHITAPVVTQTDVFTLSQPLTLHRPRWQPPVIPYFEGATVQDTSIFTQDVYIEGPTLRIVQSAKDVHPQAAVIIADLYAAPQLPTFLAARQPSGTTPQFEGATVQQTFPVPPLSQPQFLGQFDVNRIVNATPRFDGPTAQQTHPVPAVSQPQLLARFDINRIVGAMPRFDGAVIQQTFPVPSVSQPELRCYVPDINRAWTWVGPKQQLEGAILQQQFLFPPNQPQLLSPFDVNRLVPTSLRFEGAPRDTASFVFPLSQPRREAESRQPLDAARYFEGAIRDTASFLFPPNQPRRESESRQPLEAFKLFEGPVVDTASFLFPPSQPRRERESRQPLEAATYFEGATIQQMHPLPPLSQPQLLGKFDVNRIVGAPVRFDGPVAQQTFVFPISQPQLLGRFDLNRIVQVSQALEGVKADSASFIFPLSQPVNLRASRQPLDVAVQLSGAVQETASFLFPLVQPYALRPRSIPAREWIPDVVAVDVPLAPVNQPDERYFAVGRQQIQSAQFEGATVQATYIFPVSQPDFRFYSPQFSRYITLAPVFPVPPLFFPIGEIESTSPIGNLTAQELGASLGDLAITGTVTGQQYRGTLNPMGPRGTMTKRP